MMESSKSKLPEAVSSKLLIKKKSWLGLRGVFDTDLRSWNSSFEEFIRREKICGFSSQDNGFWP